METPLYTIKGGTAQWIRSLTILRRSDHAPEASASDAVVIKDVAIDTRLTDDGNAEVEVELEFDARPIPPAKSS